MFASVILSFTEIYRSVLVVIYDRVFKNSGFP